MAIFLWLLLVYLKFLNAIACRGEFIRVFIFQFSFDPKLRFAGWLFPRIDNKRSSSCQACTACKITYVNMRLLYIACLEERSYF
jgi:hypothetical protein